MASLDQKLKVSEIFESLQGEGVSQGTPTVFVRLAQCNLHCTWCDTKYTWDFAQYNYADEVTEQSPADVARIIEASITRRVVITGGEPLLQQRALGALFGLLSPDISVEVETNGTVSPLPATLGRVDQWNVSPKLSSAGDPEPVRIRADVLGTLRDAKCSYLKLVVHGETDFTEAEALVARLGWPRERVLFMPEANDRDQLRARSPAVANGASRRGFRFSSRLHLELWGGRRGT